KSEDYVYKNNRLLKKCKVELMISTQSSNRSINSDDRVWIGDLACDQLFWAQRRNAKKSSHKYYLRSRYIYFRCIAVQSKRAPMQTLSKTKFKFKSYCPTSHAIVQCCNIVRLRDVVAKWKMKGQCILGMIVQPAAIAGTNFDGKFVISFPWHRHAFGVIEALLAQMGKMGYNAADEQVGRDTCSHQSNYFWNNELNSPSNLLSIEVVDYIIDCSKLFLKYSLIYEMASNVDESVVELENINNE
ncbi:hypothetical protein RFI_25279, partial [Reticulomyxa filosa]